MAAVTITSTKRNVAGSVRQTTFDISGTSGDTLDVGLANVTGVFIEPATNSPTSLTRTASTPVSGMTRLTFTSGGAFTNVRILVQGT
jgi:hypothetical protein